MPKSTVTVTCDKDKVEAADLFLKLKDSYIELELQKCVDDIYKKNVPAAVRDYIKKKTDMAVNGEEE